ncbi:o-methyltransferase [Colletotrichum truncatum]|uniref:O-methyltransferase n=1 Tax=Colletotrichum truncatum TaxID=5467 RepID=A0ACC3ZDX8_COLTU|nr:o-methyltransferase [Colletotrichum truncatum]KAF6794922.1 o-methyltransferase [Colletotrichum truncatum]
MAHSVGQTNISTSANSRPAQNFVRAAHEVATTSFRDELERSEVLQATYELIGKLETPWETYVRILLSQPAVIGTLKVMKDLRLFQKWNEKGNQPMTSVQLADLVGKCDSALLCRMLRLLASSHLIEQIPVDLFKPKQFCIELNSHFGVLLDYYFFATHKMYGEMHSILADMGYKNPVDVKDTIFQRAKGYKGDLWSYCREHPEWGETFNMLQKVSTEKESPWMDMYPYQTLVANSDPNLPLFVDVGGGIGHDLMRLYNAYPELAPRLYLADLPEVVAANIVPEAVKKLNYDFFTPQPIKHAKVYYLHHIIHDWSDEPARKILLMQKDAMKPGYSRILIHDQILDDEKSQMSTAAFDMAMMVYLAGQERTEKQWVALLDSVGLKTIKFWKKPPDAFSVIEVELP